VETLTKAYRTHTGLRFGATRFPAAAVASIVDSLHVIVFPQVNPDGRHYSLTVDPMWRKNRRPGQPVGVDLNRNYDWLWNFPQHFAANAPVVSSTNPADDIYIGPSAASEPETQNVVWILDQNPGIAFFMDVHSFSEDLLYTWGDDDNQSVDPAMNFTNPAYDAARGITVVSGKPGAGAYREHIDAADQAALAAVGADIANAIKGVRGRAYKVVQSANGLYVTSGTSDDYCYSRHLVDPGKKKILGYTMEWGPYHANDVAGSFHPPYAEMRRIISETTAGLVQFCVSAVAHAAAP
jgi:murein tripeptide amidase MpaA